MTEKKDTTTNKDTAKQAGDQAETARAEVADRVADELQKGYRGSVPDETPNEAYSLKSGPDAPPLATDDRTRFAQPAAVKEETNGR